jgi:hypothetical protein
MGLLGQKINNVMYDFSCVEFTIANLTFRGVQSISWSDARDHVTVYGAGVEPLGATPGQWSGSGSIELLMSDYSTLYKTVNRLYDSEFAISVVYSLGGNLPIAERLPKCLFTARSGDQAQGSAVLTRRMDFLMLEPIQVDNKSPNAESSTLLGDIFAGMNIIQNLL